MNHFTSPDFWNAYRQLPRTIQSKADRQFSRLNADATHPSLHFKKTERFWSARVDQNYRAVAVSSDADLIWFWIGGHADYDKLLR